MYSLTSDPRTPAYTRSDNMFPNRTRVNKRQVRYFLSCKEAPKNFSNQDKHFDVILKKSQLKKERIAYQNNKPNNEKLEHE